jgi:hypothetical protein
MKKILSLLCLVFPGFITGACLRAEPFEHPAAPYTQADLAVAKQRALAGR